MCDIALRLAQVFVLCQKNGKLLRTFEDLNKGDKAFSFRSFHEKKLHRFRAFVSRRICITKRDRISSSRETNKRLVRRVLSLDANKGLEKHSDCTMIPNQNQAKVTCNTKCRVKLLDILFTRDPTANLTILFPNGNVNFRIIENTIIKNTND